MDIIGTPGTRFVVILLSLKRDVLSESLEVDFVKETVEILIRDYGITLHKETIIHSDQGSHYTSITFIEILKDNGIRQSMSRGSNCLDNAPQESFFEHMKDHLMQRNLLKIKVTEKRRKRVSHVRLREGQFNVHAPSAWDAV